MTPQERKVFELALEALEEAWYHVGTFQPTEKAIDLYDEARTAIKEALAQPYQEPVKISHKHEWFRTGEMKVGQMRCISCGTWGQEEIPQRTWVGLTDEEIEQGCKESWMTEQAFQSAVWWAEDKLKEKNTREEE